MAGQKLVYEVHSLSVIALEDDMPPSVVLD